MQGNDRRLLAPWAWVAGRWERNVLLTVAEDGTWESVIASASPEQQAGARRLSGPALPGLVNAHGHAFQRAIAGLTERQVPAAGRADDFWSWRDRMYTAANRITPAQLEAIACHLYRELLAGGYTQVCEFHYLHNDIDGRPHANPLEMSLALVRAARQTGMGLTLLPTLYMRSGFDAKGLRDDQRRFASTPESVLRVADEVQRHLQGHERVNVGVGVHSLRAVDPGALFDLASAAKERNLPVHIHVAEQTREVSDCVAHTGERPIEWLLHHAQVDSRWNLVHATHATADELQGVQKTGASIVLCPATEANLGDGVFDLPAYAAAKGRWSIGSDSHITRSWPEKLRLLEYSQRLTHRQRNVAARVLGAQSSAAALFDAALSGGCAATGLRQGGLLAGHRADHVVLDTGCSALVGLPAEFVLDALVFSSPSAAFTETFVAGRRVLPCSSPVEVDGFAEALQALWGAGRLADRDAS